MPISQEKIQEHTRLLNALNALDYVPAAHQHNNARLQVIDREINARHREVMNLEQKTKSEYKDYNKAKSPTRQFILRIRQGEEAVNQRLEKEEKEYKEAYQAERRARDELAMLMGEKRERETSGADLNAKQAMIDDLKVKIEALYEGLFAGPTPEYPEEEAAERRFKATELLYNRTQSSFNKHSTALASLIKAEKTMRTCRGKVLEARTATAKITNVESLGNISEQLIQCSSLLSAKLTISIAQGLLQQADESSGCSVLQAVGPLNMIPNIPATTEWDGEKYITYRDPDFLKKLDECLKKLEEAHIRLQGEIDQTYTRLDEYHNSVRELTTELQTRRKELADIRFQIMMRVTDPATLEARSGVSAPNAHEVGDSELPVYFDSTNTGGRPTTDPRGNLSISVPTYEESQAQAKPVGGFRVELPSAGSPSGPSPAYILPTGMPTPGPAAPGPAGVGGFRVPPNDNLSGAPPLELQIPEPRGNSSPSPATPVVIPPSPLTPGRSAQPSQPRPVSWSLNPYASAMIRRASTDEGASPPGGWKVEVNPFMRMVAEDPDTANTSQTEGATPSAGPSSVPV